MVGRRIKNPYLLDNTVHSFLWILKCFLWWEGPQNQARFAFLSHLTKDIALMRNMLHDEEVVFVVAPQGFKNLQVLRRHGTAHSILEQLFVLSIC